MPAIPYRAPLFTSIGELVPDSGVTPGYLTWEGAHIRTVGSDGFSYDPNGVVVAAAEFTTQAVPMAALTEVFGIQVSISSPDGKDASSAVKVQVTLDGSNYLWWGGASWVAAGVGDFNTLEDFNDNCATLNLQNPRKLGFKVQLSAFNSMSPILHSLVGYVEFESLTFLDLFTTLHGLVTDEFKVPVTRHLVLEAAASTFVLDDEYVTVADGKFKVFNLSTDEYKNVDLFSSFDGGSDTVTLTGEQAANSRLEITFQGTAPVQVARADEMIEVATIPVTFITVEDTDDVPRRLTGSLSDYKLGANAQLVRTRLHPTYRSAMVRIEHASRSPREALAGVTRMEEVLNHGIVLQSTGETLKVVLQTSAGLRDYPGQSHFAGLLEVTVFFHEHAPSYKEYNALGKIKINIGGGVSKIKVNIGGGVSWQADQFEVGG